MSNTERSFIVIEPDGVARGLASEMIGCFERRGDEPVAMKPRVADGALVSRHCAPPGAAAGDPPRILR